MTTVTGTLYGESELEQFFGARGRILRGNLTALPPSLVPKAGRRLEGTHGDIGEHQRDPRDRAWHREGRVHQDLGDAASGQKIILSILTILSRFFHEAFAKKANMGAKIS